ncbi:MAG: tetratricopeptide repeat protein [Patescibacteria group bacterium]
MLRKKWKGSIKIADPVISSRASTLFGRFNSERQDMDVQTLRDVALTHVQNKRWELAIAYIRRVLEENPNDAVMLHSLGLTLWKSGKPEEAIEPLKLAVQKASSLHPIATLGHLYQEMGNRWREAVVAFELSVVAEQETGRQERIRQALQDLQEARLSLTPPNGEFCREFLEAHDLDLTNLLKIGSLRNSLRLLKSAISVLEEYLKDVPDDVVAHCKLADSYAGEGQLESAEAHVVRALELDPNSWDANLVAGLFYSRTRRLTQAEIHLGRALELNPMSPMWVRQRLESVKELLGVAT